MKELTIVGRNIERVRYNSENELYRALKQSREEVNITEIIRMFRADQRGMVNIGELLDGFGGLLGRKSPAQEQQAAGYPSALQVEMGDAAYATAAQVVTFVPAVGGTARIWEFSVPPRHQYAWGSGVAGLSDNQGYWTFALVDATTGFATGLVTLGIESYDRHVFIPVEEKLDSVLHSGTNTTALAALLIDKKQMQELPEKQVLAAAYSRLVINYKSISLPAAVDDCQFRIPVTVYS